MKNKNILLIFIFFLILFLTLDEFYSKKNNSSCVITSSDRVNNSYENNKYLLNSSGKTKQSYNITFLYKKGIIEYERNKNAINEYTDRYQNIVERRKKFERHVHDELTKEWGAIEVEFPENKIIILKNLKPLELIDLVDKSEENLIQLHRQWWQRNYKFIPEERKIIFL